MADRVERLTNLLALLLETSEPVSLIEIAAGLEGQYPDQEGARRQAFERDKAALRELGIPIDTEILAGGPYAGQTRYRIERRKYELADLALEADEMHALQVAVAAVRTGSGSGQSAIWKLGGALDDEHPPVSASVPDRPELPVLRAAVASRSTVEFGYRGARRRLDPWGLLLRGGFWYVVGHDHDRHEQRTFRVDRFDGGVGGITVGPAETFERPASFDPRAAFPADPKQIGQGPDDSVDATVLIDALRAPAAVRELGEARVVRRHSDGSVELLVPAANLDAFRSWLLGLLQHAVVLGPPEVRGHVIEWLTAVVDGERGAMKPPRNAEERLQRLLVMLPWLMEVGEVPLADVARRFDMTEADVQKNLELVAMCGLPPFVDEMIDVFVDEGVVFVGVPRLFTRPLRLTAPEGFALLASARAAMELPGADVRGPLGRGLAKLAAVLDDAGLQTGDITAGVVFDLHRPALTDELAEYTATGAEVTIDHYSPDRDEVTPRTIVPRHVFAESGRWYVVADDDRSGERRTFRIDRIERIEPTGRHVPTEDHVSAPSRFFIDADVPRAVLRLAAPARWIIDEYPVDEVTELSSPEGWVEVRLPVASPRWLHRLLIRLGPDAELVEPSAAADEAIALARELLSRYA